MAHPSAELQETIFQALTSDPALTALLGGPKVFDRRPEHATFPYLTLGRTAVVDWSTGTEDGAEHDLTLHVWSRSGGKKQVQEILEAIRTVLHDQPLALPDHHLINLRHEFSEARLDPDGDTFHGIVRYRAVTEPAQAATA